MKSTEERNRDLMALPGFVVLIKKPNDETIYGPVENSFSLSVVPNRTQFHWTGTAYDNLLVAKWELDGKAAAERSVAYWKREHPDWEFSIHDARDGQALPIVINWELWLDAHEPAENSSGKKNKYDCRNLQFVKKGEDTSGFQKSTRKLSTVVTTITLGEPKHAV